MSGITQEELDDMAKAQAYYAGQPAAPPPPGPIASMPPQVDPGPLYPYGSYADAPPSLAAPDPLPYWMKASGAGSTLGSGGLTPLAGAQSAAANPAPAPPPAPPSPETSAAVAALAAPIGFEAKPAPPGPPGGAISFGKPIAGGGGVAPVTRGGTAPGPSGGHGGGPAGPSAMDRLYREKSSTYDQQKSAIQAGADAEIGRSGVMAEGLNDIARQRQDAADAQQMEAQDAARRFQDYSAETQKQIDDVRSKTIDPNRAYSDTGSKVSAVIGGLLGGLYQGLNHLSSNPFIDQMNKVIDRDIAAQETDLKTHKEAIGERKGLLAEMRATYKDEALAKAQAKNLYLEGAKEQLLAQAAQYDSPAIQARADKEIPELTRAQYDLGIQKLMQEAAARNAAGAAARAAEELRFKHDLELRKAGQEDRKLDIEAGKEGAKKGQDAVGRFVGTGKDAQGQPIGYLERNVEGAKEREASRIAAGALISKIDDALAIRNEQGTLGRTINRQDPNQTIQLYTPEWQTKIRGLHAEMLTDWAHAKKLGVLSASDIQMGDTAIGDLESRGSRGDVALNHLKSLTQKALDAEDAAASGQRVTKVIGADGHEHIVPTGQSNAPNNVRAVPRTPVGH